MRLEKWALLAEILSAAGVIVSLVFVGLQVRQRAEETALNTRAIQTSAYQDLTAQQTQLNTLIVENPGMAGLYQRVIVDGRQPDTPQEYQQARAYFLMAYRQGEMAFRQYESGLIDEPGLLAMIAPVRDYIATPMGGEIWRGHRALDPRYTQYVDSLPSFGKQ